MYQSLQGVTPFRDFVGVVDSSSALEYLVSVLLGLGLSQFVTTEIRAVVKRGQGANTYPP